MGLKNILASAHFSTDLHDASNVNEDVDNVEIGTLRIHCGNDDLIVNHLLCQRQNNWHCELHSCLNLLSKVCVNQYKDSGNHVLCQVEHIVITRSFCVDFCLSSWYGGRNQKACAITRIKIVFFVHQFAMVVAQLIGILAATQLEL